MKSCGKCEKTVYPTEELKCLDKTWHKACFRCWECNLMLNMNNYKGYNKLPYCSTHCPKPKHTQVANTPENNRLAEQTKLQSQLNYHAEHEKMKGNKITIVDDPETVRVRKTQEQVSQANYHGHASKAEMMERNRLLIDAAGYPSSAQSYTTPADHSDRSGAMGYVAPGAPFYAPPGHGHAGITPPADYDGFSRKDGPPSYGHSHPEPDYHRQPEPMAPQPPPPQGPRYRAIYDYQAADVDEVSLRDGDIIVNVQRIDQGWMTGTVERTQQSGMLPANYVEPF